MARRIIDPQKPVVQAAPSSPLPLAARHVPLPAFTARACLAGSRSVLSHCILCVQSKNRVVHCRTPHLDKLNKRGCAMGVASLIRLIALSCIWGGSFLFMRVGAPIFGPVLLIGLRVSLAAVFLGVVSMVLGQQLGARRHWKHFLLLGLFNSALPFLLLSRAALTLPASMLSVLNATAPVWGAVIAAVRTRTGLTAKSLAGQALGIIGVAMLVGLDATAELPETADAVLLALGAAFSYGLATNIAKAGSDAGPLANASGSMWAATLLLAPAVPFYPPYSAPNPGDLAAVAALGVICSGVAYLLYFRLIADIGAAPALTVTFLIPVFGILWGWLFLAETIGWHTLAGCGIILLGTALVTGFSPAALRMQKDGNHA